MRHEEVLHRIKDRHIAETVKRKKANWIGHILRRNYLLKHIIGGKIKGRREVTGRRGKQLPGGLNLLAPELFFFLILAHTVYKM